MGSGKETLIFCEPDLMESLFVILYASIGTLSPPNMMLMQTIDKELSSI